MIVNWQGSEKIDWLVMDGSVGIGIVEEAGRCRIRIKKGRGRQVRAEIRRAQVHRDAGNGASVMLESLADASPSSHRSVSLPDITVI
ncbi:hypothetical protein BHE74_00056626 [Ensete ventricosum]|nr:hypothetical protein GW17_00035298 [Ensete ventricosum]RWW38159.1 hypothetical protein BHE74_00056626 [Ensete ventricosum]RZS01515.1 hypothetical protein BHM03_00031392 [Ensete ventricosum]